MCAVPVWFAHFGGYFWTDWKMIMKALFIKNHSKSRMMDLHTNTRIYILSDVFITRINNRKKKINIRTSFILFVFLSRAHVSPPHSNLKKNICILLYIIIYFNNFVLFCGGGLFSTVPRIKSNEIWMYWKWQNERK